MAIVVTLQMAAANARLTFALTLLSVVGYWLIIAEALQSGTHSQFEDAGCARSQKPSGVFLAYFSLFSEHVLASAYPPKASIPLPTTPRLFLAQPRRIIRTAEPSGR